MSGYPEKVILDVDTGSDDAIALAAALLNREQFDVLGICTVNGNVEVSLVTDNTLRVVSLCDREDVGVYRGADLPIKSTLTPWTPQYTGIRCLNTREKPKPNPRRAGTRTGYDETHPEHLPIPETDLRERSECAVSFYLKTLLAAEDHSVTLVPVGPLTNIALAMRADPRICKKIRRIICMGGGHYIHMTSAAAEFNIWVDPEAAEIVLQSGCDILFVSLDATNEAYMNVEEAKEIRKIGTGPAALVADLIEQRAVGYGTADAQMRDWQASPIHDALAVCAVIHPEVLRDVRKTNCHVVLTSSHATGETLVDDRDPVMQEEANCSFAHGADRDLFCRWLSASLMGKPF